MTRYVGPAASMARWDGLCAWDQGSQKGAHLWEEYKVRWVRILGSCTLAATSVGMAALYTLATLDHWAGVEIDPSMRVFLLFMAGMFVLIAVLLVTMSIKIMPFRVYEGGVTRTMVPLRDGLEGRESYVPSEDVKEVTWETIHNTKGPPSQHFRFHLVDGTTFDVSGRKADELAPWLLHVLPCPVEVPE